MSEPGIAVVVGGASGIGWATATTLAGEGYTVVIADTNLGAAEERATQLGPPHRACFVDVTDEATVEDLFESATESGGPLDAVVNCAGTSGLCLAVDMDADLFRKVLDVNVTGSFLVAKHSGRRIRAGGSLVFLSSLNARQAAVGMSAYCASKAAVSMLTQTVAMELGPHGVRVNAVAPGLVITPMTEPALAFPGVREDFSANTPLGREGSPEDVANTIAFVCSDKAAQLTGEIIDLNGGAHLMRYPDMYGHVMRAMGC